MRIFTGIALGEEVRRNILKELKPFQKIGAPIRWTEEGNIHLTLKFIGEVGEPLAARIGEELEKRLPAAPPFRLRARGFGKFPEGDDFHVFWAGVDADPHLQALFAGIESALEPLGIARDARPFHPHITLGRNKASRSRGTGTSGPMRSLQPSMRGGAVRHNVKPLLALLEEKGAGLFGEWPVAAYRLFSSRLLPTGPVYTLLKEIPLVQS